MIRRSVLFLVSLAVLIALGGTAHATSFGYRGGSFGSYGYKSSVSAYSVFNTGSSMHDKYSYGSLHTTNFMSHDNDYDKYKKLLAYKSLLIKKVFKVGCSGGNCDHKFCDYRKPPGNEVPEPSAAVVFALGALLVGARSRRS